MEFLKAGGPFMILLVLTSIVGLAFIIERGLALRWSKVVPESVEKAVEDFHAGDPTTIKQVCLLKPSPLSRLLLVAIDRLKWPKAENVDALQTRARHEVVLEVADGVRAL